MERSEQAFLKALAERPGDRALRLVFSDWLLEQGDPRGEAMALFERGQLSSAERRRLEKLQQQNGRRWLGALADVVSVDECRFAGGLLHTVRFPAGVPAAAYEALTGEPRLATVERLAIAPGRIPSSPGAFLAHPVLGSVTRLEADVGTLTAAASLGCSPQCLRVALWNPREDLAALAAYQPVAGATVLALSTIEFLNPELAEELAEAVVASGVLAGRKRLELIARFATVEGVTRWLRVAAARARGPGRGTLQRWAVEYAETHLGLQGEHFEHFTIDATAEGGRDEVGTRVATAASVLVLLDGIGITHVDVVGIPGGRLKKDELNTLRAAVRRIRTLKQFCVAGVPQSP